MVDRDGVLPLLLVFYTQELYFAIIAAGYHSLCMCMTLVSVVTTIQFEIKTSPKPYLIVINIFFKYNKGRERHNGS